MNNIVVVEQLPDLIAAVNYMSARLDVVAAALPVVISLLMMLIGLEVVKWLYN